MSGLDTRLGLDTRACRFVLQALVGHTMNDDVATFEIDGACFKETFGVGFFWEGKIVFEGARGLLE